jgi:hypothetical protein
VKRAPWVLLTLLLGCGQDPGTGPDPPTAPGGPHFDPTGRFAYLYDINTRVFHGFRVDTASGALVSIPGPALEVPDSAWQLVFRP